MTDEEKLEFYKSEYKGAAVSKFHGFRCTHNLSRFIETRAMEEGRDLSQVIRRYLTIACEMEGFDRNA